MNRSTAVRDRHRRIIAKDEPPCHICGQPINYQAHHLDPLSFTVDHVTPVTRGGPDTLDNKRAAHRSCNRAKSDRTNITITYETQRHW